MKKFALILTVIFSALCAFGQNVSCNEFGNAIYCSDGTTARRNDNITYFNDGTRIRRYGHTFYIDRPQQDYEAGAAVGAAITRQPRPSWHVSLDDEFQKLHFEPLSTLDSNASTAPRGATMRLPERITRIARIPRGPNPRSSVAS